ncbi:hypothetical protein IV203_027029 [Nitzschia inconspicua]|uniref:Uncharacterized protein n=1 Tax=Nitzschia inconspicua TaxID=303405 RepID=A0A9K3LKB2_9STRA|nr:hypothetical protein IV203_027029 [Nitzschia inconspicua]
MSVAEKAYRLSLLAKDEIPPGNYFKCHPGQQLIRHLVTQNYDQFSSASTGNKKVIMRKILNQLYKDFTFVDWDLDVSGWIRIPETDERAINRIYRCFYNFTNRSPSQLAAPTTSMVTETTSSLDGAIGNDLPNVTRRPSANPNGAEKGDKLVAESNTIADISTSAAAYIPKSVQSPSSNGTVSSTCNSHGQREQSPFRHSNEFPINVKTDTNMKITAAATPMRANPSVLRELDANVSAGNDAVLQLQRLGNYEKENAPITDKRPGDIMVSPLQSDVRSPTNQAASYFNTSLSFEDDEDDHGGTNFSFSDAPSVDGTTPVETPLAVPSPHTLLTPAKDEPSIESKIDVDVESMAFPSPLPFDEWDGLLERSNNLSFVDAPSANYTSQEETTSGLIGPSSKELDGPSRSPEDLLKDQLLSLCLSFAEQKDGYMDIRHSDHIENCVDALVRACDGPFPAFNRNTCMLCSKVNECSPDRPSSSFNQSFDVSNDEEGEDEDDYKDDDESTGFPISKNGQRLFTYSSNPGMSRPKAIQFQPRFIFRALRNVNKKRDPMKVSLVSLLPSRPFDRQGNGILSTRNPDPLIQAPSGGGPPKNDMTRNDLPPLPSGQHPDFFWYSARSFEDSIRGVESSIEAEFHLSANALDTAVDAYRRIELMAEVDYVKSQVILELARMNLLFKQTNHLIHRYNMDPSICDIREINRQIQRLEGEKLKAEERIGNLIQRQRMIRAYLMGNDRPCESELLSDLPRLRARLESRDPVGKGSIFSRCPPSGSKQKILLTNIASLLEENYLDPDSSHAT